MAKSKMYKRPNGLYEKVYTIDGKKVHFYGKTEREILEKYRNYQEKIDNGPLFSDVAKEWLDAYEKEVEYNTYYKQMTYYNKVCNFFGDKYLKDITPSDVNQFYLNMESQKYAKKTIANAKTTLSNIFKFGIIQGFITLNPVLNVPIPRKALKTKRLLPTDEELATIKNNVSVSNISFFAYFLLCTGCRKGEALALKYNDIDFKNMQIHITKSVYFKNNKPYIKQPKTDAGVRSVPLLNILIPFIPKGKGDNYIFSVDGSEPYNQSKLTRDWAKYQKETGITATMHQLRHAYATILYEANIDEKLAQSLMGHEDIQTTRNIYTHIRSQRIDYATEKLNNLKF